MDFLYGRVRKKVVPQLSNNITHMSMTWVLVREPCALNGTATLFCAFISLDTSFESNV